RQRQMCIRDRYKGAIDNDRSGKNIEQQYLRGAFDSALSGGTISISETKAFGCSIKRAGGAN
ncbi:MAG: hypothetical protein QUS14_17025, partial [Pyrinomonadaceae bacterium]|nr:hypothetical protein [Pyrinomonadaceae bacterium]